MDVATDAAEFSTYVQPGDVLAFDSLNNVSGLIQWADRAPTNHIALMSTQGQVVMADKPTDRAPAHAVVERPLRELVDLPAVVGIRVLRPEYAAGVRERLLATLHSYTSGPTAFSYLDLGFLAPAALMRSYEPGSFGGDVANRLARVLGRIADAALRAAGHGSALTCSGFAYLCLARAGVVVDIPSPIGLSGGIDGWSSQLQEADADRWAELERRNLDLTDCVGVADAAPLENVNRATPGDFLRSGMIWRAMYVKDTWVDPTQGSSVAGLG